MSKLIERDGKYLIEVGPNDSFGSIAYEHTGQSSRWLELTKCNDVDVTRPIVSGILLKMPDSWAKDRAPSVEPRIESANPEPNAPTSLSHHEIVAVIKEVVAPWTERADRTLGELQDQVNLLEMKRDQDEKRLAEQGAAIITLKAQLLETIKLTTAAVTTAPVVEDPNRTGASGGTG